jgi:HK97 family phage prohead protease
MMDRFSCPLEVKFDAGAVDGTFSGYGSTFENEDHGGDLIKRGAFSDTLKEWKSRGKLPKMLLQHGGFFGAAEDMVPIGKWTSMTEDSMGLQVEGRLFALDTDRGKGVYAAMKEGELDGLSIGYRAKEFSVGTKPGEPYRTIRKADLSEVSVVLFGMNPKALITGVKSRLDVSTIDWRDLEAALRDGGLSRGDAVKAIAGFKGYFRRDAGETGTGPRDEDAAELVATLKRAADRIRA